MKVLVATKLMQGQRKNDFCWATEGELVALGMECDGEAIDGPCGCHRSFIGVESAKATTTACVFDATITLDEYAAAILAGWQTHGWVELLGEKEATRLAKMEAGDLVSCAEQFYDRTVLEKRGEKIQARESAETIFSNASRALRY